MPTGATATAVVARVVDGDTLRLGDRALLRVIGIDTPELGRDGRPAQPLAVAARNALVQLVPAGTRIRVAGGTSPRDRYGRRLGHVLLEDGRNIAEVLIGQGLGTALIVPPDTALAACYRRVEAAARAARRGVWSLPDYAPAAAGGLGAGARGFHRVHGRVTRTDSARSSVWIEIDGVLSVRIARTDLQDFPAGFLQSVQHREVMARGYVYRAGKQLRLRVRHPLDLLVIDE
ncbi:MAG: thermonuclease family protein [Gammaproteobacteria bacterium]|nr:thermonuclease family protein [Gammaproteobacteria bacterium]